MSYTTGQEKVLLRHHNSEIYARRAAQALLGHIDRLSVPVSEKVNLDLPLMATLCKRYGVTPDHYTLVAQLTVAGLRDRYGLAPQVTERQAVEQ